MKIGRTEFPEGIRVAKPDKEKEMFPEKRLVAAFVENDILPIFTVPGGIRKSKRIEYRVLFLKAYRMLDPKIRGKVVSTILQLFIGDRKRHGSLRTHGLDSRNLRRDGWIRILKGVANVSRASGEFRIVWNEDPDRVVVHAVCRHQDLYSVE